MRSGEFARLCGTTKDTLIHYDEMGLLCPRKKDNGYRDYSAKDIARFSIVRAMVQAEFPLSRIRDMLDAPDPERLASLVSGNEAAIDARIKELQMSKRLISEIGRQTAAARKSSLDARVASVPERRVLTVEFPGESGADVVWDDVVSQDASFMEKLASLGPEALIAPYGAFASIGQDDTPKYAGFFYLMPSECWNCEAPFGNYETIPAGRYALVSYSGPWAGVGDAYQKLARYLAESDLVADKRWHEVSQMRLLDTDYDHYRCTIYAPLDERFLLIDKP